MKKQVFFFLIFTGLSMGVAYADILIITNKDVPETRLTQKQIQEIFLGKRVQWKDNSKIRFVTIKESIIHGMFLKQYLKKSGSKWKAYWRRMVFTGRGVPPKVINTEAEIIAYVAKTKGAIGYVSSQKISDGNENTVKIIEIK